MKLCGARFWSVLRCAFPAQGSPALTALALWNSGHTLSLAPFAGAVVHECGTSLRGYLRRRAKKAGASMFISLYNLRA